MPFQEKPQKNLKNFKPLYPSTTRFWFFIFVDQIFYSIYWFPGWKGGRTVSEFLKTAPDHGYVLTLVCISDPNTVAPAVYNILHRNFIYYLLFCYLYNLLNGTCDCYDSTVRKRNNLYKIIFCKSK